MEVVLTSILATIFQNGKKLTGNVNAAILVLVKSHRAVGV